MAHSQLPVICDLFVADGSDCCHVRLFVIKHGEY
jgi:hypothetical protein